MPIHNSDGWTAEDFIDLPSPTLVEEDPWDAPLIAESQELTASGKLDVSDGSSLAASALDGKQSHSQLALDIDGLDSGDTPLDSSSGLEVETPPLDSDFPDAWFQDDPVSEIDAESQDDPVPTAEFDPDLGDDLYGPVEEINLTDVDIRLDQFLARLSLSNDQTTIVRAHLESFSQARLSNWLPWLNSKVWTPQMLTSFVQFHSHWETMPDWWESRRRSWQYEWKIRESPMSNILSRDDAYEIVRYRIGCPAQDVIDDLWFDEWDYYSMWRHGFWSFAKFAKFRATLNQGEDWRGLVEWADLDEELERDSFRRYDAEVAQQYIVGKIPLREDGAIRYSYVSCLPRWYSIQDWHPEDEWHDNLGWPMQVADLTESRITDGGPQGSIWPIGGRNV